MNSRLRIEVAVTRGGGGAFVRGGYRDPVPMRPGLGKSSPTRGKGTTMKRILFILAAWTLLFGCGEDPSAPTPDEPLGFTHVGVPAQSLAEFETVVESIRTDLKIPGLSAAITKAGRIVWARGFGYANKAGQTPATPQTVYHLASLTKPFAAALVMQLVEERKLTLETPVSDYGINVEAQGVIRVKHLLSHTSEGIPGTA